MGDMVDMGELKGALGWWSGTERKTDGCLPSWTFALSDNNATNYFM